MKHKKRWLIGLLTLAAFALFSVVACLVLRSIYYPTLGQALHHYERQYHFALMGGPYTFEQLERVIGSVKMDGPNWIYITSDDNEDSVVISYVQKKEVGGELWFHCVDMMCDQFNPEIGELAWIGHERSRSFELERYRIEGYFENKGGAGSFPPADEWVVSRFSYDDTYDFIVRCREIASDSISG